MSLTDKAQGSETSALLRDEFRDQTSDRIVWFEGDVPVPFNALGETYPLQFPPATLLLRLVQIIAYFGNLRAVTRLSFPVWKLRVTVLPPITLGQSPLVSFWIFEV